MKKQELKVSPLFAHLYDLYYAELESLSRNSENEECHGALEKAISERRAQAQEYLKLMSTNPEYSAVMFHGVFDFWTGPDSALLQRLVATSNLKDFPAYSALLNEVTVNSGCSNLVFLAESKSGGKHFLPIVIGLEYLYSVSWSAQEMVAPEELGETGDDENWGQDEAPQILGLDPLATEG